MEKIFKLLISFFLVVSLSVATVMCCCIAPSVMAHFHKAVTCSHCPDQASHGKSSNPTTACQNQLTSAELLQAQTLFSTTVLVKHFFGAAFLSDHHRVLTHSLLLAYPPGAPPQGVSFTPLYLRTFNLRI